MAQEKYRAVPKKAKPSQSPKKPAPSPEERRKLAEKKREAEEARRRKRYLQKQRRKRIFRFAFVLSLVFVALYWGFVAFSIANRTEQPDDAMPVLVFTDGERKEDTRLEAERVYFGDEIFLPVTILEEYTAISTFGDYDTRSFLISATGEYATFTLGSCNVLINGERVSMKSSAFLKDDILYLPIDFYTDKMTCFAYSHSSALAANVLTYHPEAEISFFFRGTPTSPTVNFDTVPVLPTLPEEGTEET